MLPTGPAKRRFATQPNGCFPDGLTVLTGYGQFRNSAQVIIQERSTELILLYPLQMPEANRKIQEIRENYKRAFQQESVLRVDSLATVSF